jgi:hypothetical protein
VVASTVVAASLIEKSRNRERRALLTT